MKIHLDFETRSAADLKKVGLWAYAMHPSTEVMCMGWAYPKDGVTVWRGERLRQPPKLGITPFDGVSDYLFSAHNAAFEYACYNLILHRRYGWPALWEPSRWRCTMAKALACGLPADLDSLGRVLKIKTPKDLDGRRAMLRLCKPLPDGAFDESPELLDRLYRYNATDVQAEIEVDDLMPDLSPQEQKVWELDLAINRRGVAVDLPFARRAAALSETLVDKLNGQLKVLTGGAVDKATQVTALKYYLSDRHGISTDSLDKESIVELMTDPLIPDEVKPILAARRQVGKKTSVAKYKAAVEMACPDGRVRGLLQYHAAHTGRWGGRGLQPQNFPKGWEKPAQQAEAIAHVMNGGVDCYGERAMDALSDSLRGLFVAAPGKTLVCGDFNAIEARVLFWLAGEEAALAAYRRGESPYLEMGKAIYPKAGLPNDVSTAKQTHPQEYDIAKRTVLGAGFGMWWRKFRDNIYSETSKKGKPVLVSDALAERAIRAYREKYPGVPALWREIETAARVAVEAPGRAVPCAGGRVLWGMTADRRFLACKLPSGRFLRYWQPSIQEVWKTWCEDSSCEHIKRDDVMLCPGREKRKQICYVGENSFTHQWGRISVYGGLLTENVVQATARDLLVHGMQNAADAGFEVVLTVHDEVLAETVGRSTEEFLALLCKTPDWAKGCPVAAEGWAGGRYRK